MTRRSGKLRSVGPGRRIGRRPSAILAGWRGELIQYIRECDPDVAADAVFAGMTDVVALAEDRVGLTDLRTWTVQEVDGVLTALEDAPSSDPRLAGLSLLVAFLGETGRWRGEDAALALLMGKGKHELARVLRSEAEAQRRPDEGVALNATDIVPTVMAFLQWFGPRPRPLTGTQGLRRADIHAVVEHLGLPPQPRRITSMWDHIDLSDLWVACRDTGLIAVDSARAARTTMGGRLAGGDAGAARQLVAFTVARDLLVCEPPGSDWSLLADLLLATVHGDPPEIDAEALDVDPLELLLETFEPDGGREDLALSLYLRALSDNEALTIDRGRLQIMPGLESLLLETLADLIEDRPICPAGTMLGQVTARAGQHPTADGTYYDLHLVVAEEDRPAERREVILPASSTPAELHALLEPTLGLRRGALHELTGEDPIGRTRCWTDHRVDRHGIDDTTVSVLDVVSWAADLSYVAGSPDDSTRFTVTLDRVGPTITPTR